MKSYFTIKTSSDSGLMDQLGTQFSRLFALGCACHYEYVYTPLSFPRSHGSPWLISWTIEFEKTIIFLFPWLFHFSLTKRVLRGVLKITRKIQIKLERNQSIKDNIILEFLGFKNFIFKDSDINFLSHKKIEICLFKLICENKIYTIDQFKTCIEEISPPDSSVYVFVWDKGHNEIIPAIDKILIDCGVQDSVSFTNFTLSKNYWSKHSSLENLVIKSENIDRSKNTVAVHIRLGDSVAIPLASKTLYVVGNTVYTSLESAQIIFQIDPNRYPISLSQYEIVLGEYFQKIGRQNIDCTILSDGYRRSFSTIVNALLQGQISLSSYEIKQLQQAEKFLNNELSIFLHKYSNRYVIGESLQHLLDSIHALASSHLIIYGTGGFAFYTHKLLKPDGQPSKLVHVAESANEVLGEISELRI